MSSRHSTTTSGGRPGGAHPGITRDALNRLPRRRLHTGRNVSKATIDLIEIDGRPVILKDLAERPWPVRALLGPWMLDREVRAYGRLEGLPGVPELIGRIDRHALLLEYVPGPDLGALRPGEIDVLFFDRLERLITAMHAHGVAHGDLNRSDVLAGPEGRPYVVDFSTAVLAARRSGSPRGLLFARVCRMDRRSIAKLRRRFLPGSSPPVPQRRGLHRIGAGLKRLIDRLRGRRP